MGIMEVADIFGKFGKATAQEKSEKHFYFMQKKKKKLKLYIPENVPRDNSQVPEIPGG